MKRTRAAGDSWRNLEQNRKKEAKMRTANPWHQVGKLSMLLRWERESTLPDRGRCIALLRSRFGVVSLSVSAVACVCCFRVVPLAFRGLCTCPLLRSAHLRFHLRGSCGLRLGRSCSLRWGHTLCSKSYALLRACDVCSLGATEVAQDTSVFAASCATMDRTSHGLTARKQDEEGVGDASGAAAVA